MKNDILNNLSNVMAALENVEVKGRQNCMNILGSIELVERVAAILRDCEIKPMARENKD